MLIDFKQILTIYSLWIKVTWCFVSMMQQLFMLFTCMLVVATNAHYPGTKIAANEHLFATYTESANTGEYAIHYQCSSDREKVNYKRFSEAMLKIGIGKAQNRSQL